MIITRRKAQAEIENIIFNTDAPGEVIASDIVSLITKWGAEWQPEQFEYVDSGVVYNGEVLYKKVSKE